MFVRRLPLVLLLLALGVLPGNTQSQNTPNRHSIFSIGGSIRDDTDRRAMENIPVTLKQLPPEAL